MANEEGKKKLGDGWCWGQYMAGRGRSLKRMNSRFYQTGNETDKAKDKLFKSFPTTDIAHIPREELLKVISCVRCGEIPHPDSEAMSCEQGHYTCGPCVDIGIGQGKGEDPSVNLKECCSDLRKLSKEGSGLLRDLVRNCQFKCRNNEKGCEESVSGDLFEEHYENCKFTEHVKCRFHGCTEKFPYLDDVLEHYKRDHQATILEALDNSIILPPINFKQTLAQRLCAILKIEGLYYIFGCELVSGYVFIWLWSMEHPAAGGTGLKTDARYNLRLKKLPGRMHQQVGVSLGCFEGRCLVHSVDPEVICKTTGTLAESLRIKVDLFRKLYVSEEDHGGDGGWVVGVLVKEGPAKMRKK